MNASDLQSLFVLIDIFFTCLLSTFFYDSSNETKEFAKNKKNPIPCCLIMVGKQQQSPNTSVVLFLAADGRRSEIVVFRRIEFYVAFSVENVISNDRL